MLIPVRIDIDGSICTCIGMYIRGFISVQIHARIYAPIYAHIVVRRIYRIMDGFHARIVYPFERNEGAASVQDTAVHAVHFL